MFHDSQVSDAELAQAVLQTILPSLKPIAASLFSSPDESAHWIAVMVARAVNDRRRYWQNDSLLAWVLKHAPGLHGHRPLSALPPEAKLSVNDRCLWDVLRSKHVGQGWDVWAVAVAAGLLDPEDGAAGARCSTAEMAARAERLQIELLTHLQQCDVCGGANAAAQQEDLKVLLDRVRSSLASGFTSLAAFWQWDGYLPALVKAALIRERRLHQWRIRVTETSLVVFLALAAFLAGRFAGDRSRVEMEANAPVPEIEATPGFVSYTVRPGDSLENISVRLQMPALELLALNNLPAGATLVPGQRLRLPSASLVQRPPVILEITPGPTPPGLPEEAPVEALLVRAAQSTQLWQTLWADVQVIDYGPVGYYGPAQQVLRKQVWVSQPDYVRIIYGPLAGTDLQTGAPAGTPVTDDPDGTLVVSAGLLYGHDFNNGATYRDLTAELLPDLDLQKLFLPQDLPPGVNVFDRSQVEHVAGRPARVLDAYNPLGAVMYRYWVDEQYGMVLRRREFSGADPEVALRDIVVTRIVFDARLPAEIFNPEKYTGDRFALDYSGLPVSPLSTAPPIADAGRTGHEPLPGRAAPPGYDPSTGRLSFQWSIAPANSGAYLPGLELFADSYLLGKVVFPDAISQPQAGSRDVTGAILPSILICKRSPDGRRLAFSLFPASYAVQKSILLYTLDLLEPEKASSLVPDISQLGDFAFSADGSQLAYFACHKGGAACGVYLMNFNSSERLPHSLMAVNFADYFLWSPDGKSLGFLAAQGLDRAWSYLVVRLEDGEIVEQGGFDWRRLIPQEGSMAAGWTEGSPVQAGGLDECAAPP